MSVVISFAGSTDQIAKAVGEPLSNQKALDLVTQTTAVSANLFAALPSVAGTNGVNTAAITAATAASVSAAAIAAEDYQALQKQTTPVTSAQMQELMGDMVTVLGDVAMVTGASLAQSTNPAAKFWGAIIDKVGDGLTVAGIALNRTDQVVQTFSADYDYLSGIVSNDLDSLAAALYGAPTQTNAAWASLDTNLTATLNDYTGLLNTFTASNFSSASFMTNLTTTVNSLSATQNSGVSFFNDSGLPADNLTATINSDGSVNLAGNGSPVLIDGLDLGPSPTTLGVNVEQSVNGPGVVYVDNQTLSYSAGMVPIVTADKSGDYFVKLITSSGSSESLELSNSGETGTIDGVNFAAALTGGQATVNASGAISFAAPDGTDTANLLLNTNGVDTFSLTGSGINFTTPFTAATSGGSLQFNDTSSSTGITVADGGSNFSETLSTNSSGQPVITLSGTGGIFNISNATIDLSSNANVTINGSGNGIVANSGDTANVNGNNDSFDGYGSNDLLTIFGNNNYDAMTGSADNTQATGNNNSFFSYGSNDIAFVNGTGNSLYNESGATGGSITIQGTDGIFYDYGAAATINASGADATVYDHGTNTIDNITAPNFTVVTSGTGDIADFLGTATNGYVEDDGTNDKSTITGSDNVYFSNSTSSQITTMAASAGDYVQTNDAGGTVTINGTNTNTQAFGTNTIISVSGGGDSVTSEGANQTVNLNGTNESDSISGNGTTITNSGTDDDTYLHGADDTVAVSGSGNTIVADSNDEIITSSTSTTGNYVELQGTGDTATLNGTNSTLQSYGLDDSALENGNGDAENLYNSSGALDGQVFNYGGWKVVEADGQTITYTSSTSNPDVSTNSSGDVTASFTPSSESVREQYQALHSFRNISLIEAR